MNRMRIGLVTYALRAGGMETTMLRLAARLRSDGVDAEIVTTMEPGPWFARAAEAGVPAVHLPGRDSLLPFAARRHALRVAEELVRRRYDAVLLNHAKFAQASIAALPQHVAAVPVLHNDVEEVYRVGCANADAWNIAVAVGPRVCEAARRRLGGRPVVQILNGVEQPAAGACRERTSPTAPLRLAYAGRLMQEQKGVLLLPAVLRACVDRGLDATLDVLGDGPDAAALGRGFEEAGVAHRAVLHGAVAPETVRDTFLRADVMLMPSFYEGLPVTLLEAQACGCVPVVSRLPGITDFAAADGETALLVPVGDAAAMTDAVARLADPARWTQMSRAASARIGRLFSVDAMAREYLKLVEECRAGRHPTPRPRSALPRFERSPLSWWDDLPAPIRDAGRRLLRR